MRVDGNLNSARIQSNNKGLNTNKNVFNDFVQQNSNYPTIPSNILKAYSAPQLYPEYKVLETFKLPNTGVGKVYQLRNGHKVIVLPKKGPTAINTQVGAGWQNEKLDKRDTAHLLEHLLATIQYKNNAEKLQDISDRIILDSNAGTGSYCTNYYEKAIVSNDKELDEFLKFHFSIIHSADFSDQNYEHEKTTISNEMKERNNRVNAKIISEQVGLKSLLNLPDENSLSNLVNQKHIDNINKNDLHEFYEKYYRPDNMCTTIVGNVDENTIKTFSKYFNQAKNPVLKNKDLHLEKLVTNPIQKSVRKDVINPDKMDKGHLVTLDFLINEKLSNYEKECLYFATNLVNNRLKSEIEETTSTICPIINSDYNNKTLTISSKIKHSYSEDKLQNIYNVINGLTNNPISEDELKTLKESYKDIAFLTNAEDIADYYAYNLSSNAFVTPEKLEQLRSKITSQDIQKTIKKYFNLDKVALTVVHPQQNVKQLSFKGTLKLSDLYNIKGYTLPNNVKVNINESDSVNETCINFLVTPKKILDSHNCANKYLYNAIHSTGVYNYCEKNNLLFLLQSNQQQLRYDIYGKPEKTMDMLKCITVTLLEPMLSSEEDLKKWKNINKDINTTNSPAYEKQNIEIHKNDNPWRYKKDNVSELTLKDVQDYHSQLLKNSQVAVNVTIPQNYSTQFKQQIFNELSKLPKFQEYSYIDYFNFAKATPLEKNKVFINTNDDNLIEIVKTYKIIKTGNIKDIVGLELLNMILGDGLDGMLYKKLRAEKNLTYSPGSEFLEYDYTPKYEILSLSSSSDKNNLEQVNAGFDECVKKLMTELVTQRDLNIAKKKFKSKFWGESALTQNFMGKNCDNSFYGLNYISELEKTIDELTPYDIRELAKYYFSQPALYMISGNKEAIEANKEYLKTLGEIVE